jgi:hypothetical protein
MNTMLNVRLLTTGTRLRRQMQKLGNTAGLNERAERLLKSIVMGLSTCWRRAHGRSTRFELSLPAREKKKSTQHNAVS